MTTVIIGAGQAGLTVSRELSARGIEHVVLERSRIAQSWRGRWDSFTLVSPNWTLDLPGSPYEGDDPEGHVHRDDIVDYLQRYADGCDAPIREGVEVTALRRDDSGSGGFLLDTSDGPIAARNVVVCTGAFQKQYRPAAMSQLPASVTVLGVDDYRNPAELPPGKVLVIGSGQTGCMFAEELHLAGRDVFLACGRAPWAPRWLEDQDIVTWLAKTPFFDQKLSELPSPAARLVANVQCTGSDGGRDLNYRTLQALGVPLLGRFSGVDGNQARFADDLGESVAFGDARWADLRDALTTQLPKSGIAVPELPIPAPFEYAPREQLDLADVDVVLLTSGYRPDYSWIDFPVSDDMGFPRTVDGGSTDAKGLYFSGVHFMRSRRSSLLIGAGEDARVVAEQIAMAAAG